MPFWDWLRGGAPRLAARELAQLHRRCGGDYEEVMRLSMAALIMATAQGKVSKRNAVILEQVLAKLIRNYVDLCVLFLYANSVTKQQTYEETYVKFSPEVRHWLLQRFSRINMWMMITANAQIQLLTSCGRDLDFRDYFPILTESLLPRKKRRLQSKEEGAMVLLCFHGGRARARCGTAPKCRRSAAAPFREPPPFHCC